MKMTPEMIERAKQLRDEGLSYVKIGNALGVNHGTVQYNLNPAYREAQLVYAEAHKEEKREYLHAYGVANRERISEKKRTYREENHSEVRARERTYAATHKEQKAATDRKYYLAHKSEKAEYDKVYNAANAERIKIRRAAWNKTHRPEKNANEAVRKALIAGTMIGITIAQRAQIAEIYRKAKEDPKVRCYICDELIEMGDRHVDHIIPLIKGGSSTPSNLAVACSHCNMSKHDKHPNELGILI